MFRPALLSIVLTLAVGPNASLLCEAWCHDAAPAGCAHQESMTSSSASSPDNCQSDLVAAVREDARRAAAAPGAQHVVVVPRFRLAPSPAGVLPGFESGRQRLLEERPLVIALRI